MSTGTCTIVILFWYRYWAPETYTVTRWTTIVDRTEVTKSSCLYHCSLLRASCLPMSSKPTVCAFWNLPRLFRSVARPRTCRSLVSITPAYCVEACIRWPRRTPCPCLLLVSQLHKSTLVLQAIEPVSCFLHIASLLNWQHFPPHRFRFSRLIFKP
jgi:hypothetical protein